MVIGKLENDENKNVRFKQLLSEIECQVPNDKLDHWEHLLLSTAMKNDWPEWACWGLPTLLNVVDEPSSVTISVTAWRPIQRWFPRSWIIGREYDDTDAPVVKFRLTAEHREDFVKVASYFEQLRFESQSIEADLEQKIDCAALADIPELDLSNDLDFEAVVAENRERMMVSSS